MRKFLFAVLLMIVGINVSGCFENDISEECVGSVCNEDPGVVMDRDDPIVKEDPVIDAPEKEDPVVNEDPVNIAIWKPKDNPKIYSNEQNNIVVDPQKSPAVDLPPIDDGITIDDLSPEELATVEVLRTSIDYGLVLGREQYLEAISLALSGFGIASDYEADVLDGLYGLGQTPEECPFAKYYDNGFEPTGFACDYLADMAKVEVYAELANMLDIYGLPEDIQNSPDFNEALFWYEQGAISGIEEERVAVRYDMKKRELCAAKPTPVQSSVEKGNLVGRQLLQKEINTWLSANGYVADYPVMSKPIQVCAANVSMLSPSKTKALQGVEQEAINVPLCDTNYVPPTQEGQQKLAQASIDYKKAIKSGVEDEFALAAVKIFKVIPCNVSDPLAVDLDGDGIELMPIWDGVNFDLYGTGEQAVAWISPDDGFLAIDNNRDGIILDGTELLGNLDLQYDDGFDDLASYDTDRSDTISWDDSIWADLVVWRDINCDGISDRNEVVPLSSFGVNTISLITSVGPSENIPRTTLMGGNGFTMAIGDVFLRSAPYARITKKHVVFNKDHVVVLD